MPTRFALTAALAVLLSVVPAYAQRSEARGGGHDGAKAAQMHYRRGRAHHERGEHEAAVREYLIAYELSQSPRLLFNIAQVYLLADNPEKALLYYEAFVSREPEGKISDLARQRIRELRRAGHAAPEGEQAENAARGAGSAGADDPGESPNGGAAAGSDGAGAAEAAGAAGTAGSPGASAADAGGGSALAPRRDADGGPGRAGRGMRMTGLAVLGLGAVGVGAGVAFGMQARSKQQEIDDQPQGTPWTFDEVYADGQAANRNMWIAYGAGATALIAGGVLYYMGWNAGRTEAQSWAIAPLAGAAASGITLLGEF